VGAVIGTKDTLQELIAAVEQVLAAGFPRVKVKCRPGWDETVVRELRAMDAQATIHIDCNGAYGIGDLDLFRRLDRYGLAMIEQPLAYDDILDHARLQHRIATPLCLDESITTVASATHAIEIGACRFINVKPARVGGLTTALQIHGLCRDQGVACWVGGMLESAVGANHCAALATLPGFSYPADVFPSSRFYDRDLADPPVQLSGPGQITVSSAPGIGVEPNRELLARYTIESGCVG
jgi:O-succinylbenzoate synthase